MASAEPIAGRCGAKVSVSERNPDGGYCELPPMTGQTRCGSHGGRAPQNRAAAERRMSAADIQRQAVTLGLPLDVTPEEGLLQQLRQTAGHVAWLLERVQELSPEALVWGRTSEVSKEATEFPGVDTTREAQPNVLLLTYERFQKHYMALIDLALKHKLDERRVRLAERDGREVASAFRDVLTELGHDLADPNVLRVVSSRLRALAGTEAVA